MLGLETNQWGNAILANVTGAAFGFAAGAIITSASGGTMAPLGVVVGVIVRVGVSEAISAWVR